MTNKRLASILLTVTALMIGLGILLGMGKQATVAQNKPGPVAQISGYTWSGGALMCVPPPPVHD